VKLDERYRWWMLACALPCGVLSALLFGPSLWIGAAAGVVGGVIGIALGLASDRLGHLREMHRLRKHWEQGDKTVTVIEPPHRCEPPIDFWPEAPEGLEVPVRWTCHTCHQEWRGWVGRDSSAIVGPRL
jgi:hypothetical protein